MGPRFCPVRTNSCSFAMAPRSEYLGVCRVVVHNHLCHTHCPVRWTPLNLPPCPWPRSPNTSEQHASHLPRRNKRRCVNLAGDMPNARSAFTVPANSARNGKRKRTSGACPCHLGFATKWRQGKPQTFPDRKSTRLNSSH